MPYLVLPSSSVYSVGAYSTNDCEYYFCTFTAARASGGPKGTCKFSDNDFADYGIIMTIIII